jgi:hypothetical protein
MLFEPVWVSSIKHLDEFHALWSETSWIRRLTGTYVLPEQFPHMHFFWLFESRVPVLMFASGRLLVEDRILDFTSMPWELPSGEYRNLRADFAFRLTDEDINLIKPFTDSPALIQYYRLPFLRFRTSKPAPLSDFLLCVGGHGLRMGKIRERNAEFAARLREMFPAATV